MFRYFTINAENHLVELNEEITFTKNYARIISYRYPAVSIEFDESLQYTTHCRVCPFSIQPLVENAIQHNQHGTDSSLKIMIFRQDNYIAVVNNLLPVETVSTKKGLTILQKRYQLICGKKIIIKKTAAFFQVLIPVVL